MTDTTEYMPEQGGQDGKQTAPEDTRTRIIIQARNAALDDGDLEFGARVLFTKLLDLSLSWYTQKADGVVCISVTKLCELIKCAPRTIYGWNKQLVAKRHLWITEQKMPNMWPVNTYHISALDSPNEPRQMPTKDGMWGNGVRREKAEAGEGARAYPCKKQHASEYSFSSKTAQNAPESGNGQHLSAANFAAGSGKEVTGEPQSLPRGAAKNAAGSRKKQHLAAAKNSSRPPQPTAVNKETQIPDNEVLEHPFNCKSSGISSQLKKKAGETDFLLEVARTVARFDPKVCEREMAEYGGWWRNRFRENPGKSWRVLNEVERMIKEGQMRKNPGAEANRLWKDFK